jgi:hypothetical protein
MQGQQPDFSNVDSLEKAQQLCREGTLEQVYLFPLKFGGQEIPPNIVYVPLGIAAIMQRLDGRSRGTMAYAQSTRLGRSERVARR